jgi:zinc/manganese transport system substrate-binding protein
MKIGKITWLLLVLTASLLIKNNDLFAADKIRVVTTTNTLASIVHEIAREKVDVYFIASPNRNIHFISPTPKDVVKIKKADVFIHQGLDLEAWRNPLLNAAGRLDFIGKGERAIDVSVGVPLLEIPTSLSRTQGDIHAFGNPHYQMDPLNAKITAQNIAEGLARLYPEDSDFFKKNAEEFNRKIDEKMQDWSRRAFSFKDSPVVTYHKNWIYFTERFGLVIVGELEPKPGIPPTAKHIAELEKTIKEKGVKAILKESFYENKTPQKLAKETGTVVLNLVQDVGASKEAQDYISMIESDFSQIEQALNSTKAVPQ